MKTVPIVVLALAAVIVLAGTVNAELKVGPPRADPRFAAKLVIHNSTGVAIPYQLRWGSKGEWKNFTVHSGYVREHTATMDVNGQALVPYVRFDRIAGDSRSTPKEYELDFGKVGTGSRGSGSAINYEFKYAADQRHLDLYNKR